MCATPQSIFPITTCISGESIGYKEAHNDKHHYFVKNQTKKPIVFELRAQEMQKNPHFQVLGLIPAALLSHQMVRVRNYNPLTLHLVFLKGPFEGP